MTGWLLEKFNRWFCSGAGVWQTFFLAVAVAAWELLNPSADPHGFWLLYALTIYSAVTQPALAHAGQENGEKIESMLQKMQALLDHHDIEAP